MNEVFEEEIVERYESLPVLQWRDFQPGNFLHWNEKNEHVRKEYFQGARSFIEGLELILHIHPNVLMVRGAGLKSQIDVEANFSVGEIETAQLYSKRDVHLQPHDYPIILYAPLDAVLHVMRQGVIEPIDRWEVYKDMLIDHGVMNLRFLHPSGYQVFTLRKPNHSKAPNMLSTTI